MQYWRMQLHPADSALAMRYTAESLAAGFIGLDFGEDPGDLRLLDRATLGPGNRDYVDFADTMQVGDKVLVIVHHFPFALVTVSGDYTYITAPDPQLGVWFKHFRRVDRSETRYYADRVTNARQWEATTMTDTISVLRSRDSASYRLIESWV